MQEALDYSGHMGDGHKDYSETPLSKKLGIVERSSVVVIGAPDGFLALLRPLPRGVKIFEEPQKRARSNIALLFVTRRSDLQRSFTKLAAALVPEGRLWVAWPKKASKVETDLDFDRVQRTGLEAGLVDNKSASITDMFQGVQFVRRLRDRPRS
jgi:hypothetical protein